MNTPDKIDRRLEVFGKLCNDLDYRDKIFSKEESQVLLQKLELRDFPIKTLLTCPTFDLGKSLLSYEYVYAKTNGRRDKRGLKITPKDQLTFIPKLLGVQDKGNSLIIVTGITDFQKARFISFLLVFCRLLGKSGTTTQYKPLWHYVKGGFDDPLRDSEEQRMSKGNINYLILDGLSISSSKLKIEKFNDLLSSYQNSRMSTDIIIIAAGFDPLKVAAECLNTSFQAGLYLDEGLVVSL